MGPMERKLVTVLFADATGSTSLADRLDPERLRTVLDAYFGAMAAAVFMLVVNDVVAVWWSPTWAPLVFFVALVIVLSVRPQGLFGRTAVRAQ